MHLILHHKIQITLILSNFPRAIKIELPITPELAIITLYEVLNIIIGSKRRSSMHIFKRLNLDGFEESVIKLDLIILFELLVISSLLFFFTCENIK